MRSYVLFLPNRKECAQVSDAVRFLIKRQGIRQLPDELQKLDGLKAYTNSTDPLKLLVCDTTAPGVLPVLEVLRGRNNDMKLILLADDTISPVSYIRPTILPTSLPWRPLDTQVMTRQLSEVMGDMGTGTEQTDEEQSFNVEVRGDVRRFLYSQILFFEARDKKLFLHQNRAEIPFQGTLEKLTEQLPDMFMRVHKSFVVNKRKVKEIQFGQNQMILDGGMIIPISRSYKADVKAVFL